MHKLILSGAACILFLTGALSPRTHASVSPLAGKVIVVDAGHGGMDGGARGINGIVEKDITLPVARQLALLLRQSGAYVVETRASDHDLATDADRLNKQRHLGDLKGRLMRVRNQQVDAFVSIHCNAAPSSSWHGAQVLYLKQNEDGKALAESLQKSYQEHLLPTRRSVQSNGSLYLLKRIPGPTVLAEIGFITNGEEGTHLETRGYQSRVAFATYIGLLSYFAEGPRTGEDSLKEE